MLNCGMIEAEKVLHRGAWRELIAYEGVAIADEALAKLAVNKQALDLLCQGDGVAVRRDEARYVVSNDLGNPAGARTNHRASGEQRLGQDEAQSLRLAASGENDDG